ncbi:unannotated protein [freshwater metagenome]|uniref:Unannotated protein n=1 Tax=freshwater metagenome TaxID=449393 RepID=A0A6J6IGP2_9ZZZZ|nr:6-phosphogluconolactonase [Actinomycetota bacterium]
MNLDIRTGFASSGLLATTAAMDLSESLKDYLARQDEVNLVLTGGTVGNLMLEALSAELVKVDLSKLQLWWGDERFVQKDSQDRNFVQAEKLLLSRLTIPKENLHQMPSSETLSLDQAAAQFANEIELVAPLFDIVLLGMGADAHVASLFPELEGHSFGDWVIAQDRSPKPPKDRISLSYKALCSASEVWFLVAGADKAQAVKRVFAGEDLPAAKVSGQKITKWYLDQAAASETTF